MAIIVDPLWLDLHEGSQERRGPEQYILGGSSSRHQAFPISFIS